MIWILENSLQERAVIGNMAGCQKLMKLGIDVRLNRFREGSRVVAEIPVRMRNAGAPKALRQVIEAVGAIYPADINTLAVVDEQNMSGKTTLSEMPEVLVHGHLIQKMKGNSLTSGFTGNSDTAVFVIIEELNLNAKADMAIEMKRRITATMLESERKHQNARLANHFGKYIQTCNDASYIPFTPGDDRLVGWQVMPLKPDEIIPNMRQKLAEEAPAIRHKLESYVLPSESAGRAFLPILMTDLKRQALLEMATDIPPWLLDLMLLAGGDKAKETTKDRSAAELAAMVQTHRVSFQRISKHLQLDTTRDLLRGQGYTLTFGAGKNEQRNSITTYTIEKL